jgi:flagella basal body P-ring formation protein FlgA
MKRRFIILTIAFILAILAAGISVAAEFSVTLPSEIEARDGWFYLGEYAELEGEREVTDSASMAVISHNGSFSREDVIDALGQTDAAGKSAAITMSDRVKVVHEADIAAELRMTTAWKWRIDVDVVPGSWSELMKDYSGYSLPPKITPGARTLAIKLNDEKGRQSTKQVKLSWYQPVVYSTKPFERNAAIDRSALRTRIETTGMMVTRFWSPRQLENAVARKPMNAFTAIETDGVKQNSFVRAGSSVTMVANVNGLGIEVKGVAMQRGGLGDVIRVKNLSSKKILTARVIGDGRVEINP